MKTKRTELDVDFIGGQSSLTAAEEKALSSFFKTKKTSAVAVKTAKRRRAVKREKVPA